MSDLENYVLVPWSKDGMMRKFTLNLATDYADDVAEEYLSLPDCTVKAGDTFWVGIGTNVWRYAAVAPENPPVLFERDWATY